MAGTQDTPPETAAAESLRRHLEEIAHERDRAHRALQDREAELARVQRIGRIGGVEGDLRGGVKNHHSPEYLLIHGLRPGAASETFEDWAARIHPDDRERMIQYYQQTIRGSRSKDYSAEYRIIRPKQGEMRRDWVPALPKTTKRGEPRR